MSAAGPVPTQSLHVHATSVAVGKAGALLTGRSGSGKSALALALIGLGAKLVSDDLTRVALVDGVPVAHAPEAPLAGVIEARGVGLIHVPWQPSAVVNLIVDLDREETARLPERHVRTLLGCDINLQYRMDVPGFAHALYFLLKGGRYA